MQRINSQVSPMGVLLVALSLVLSTSCRKSVLSEISIDSPEVLTVRVKIDEKRQKKRQLQVSIRDRTNHAVKFSNGQVWVNGDPTEFSSRTIVRTARGYNYRIPADTHEFEITIDYNATESYTFMVDKDAGFPGFKNKVGWNWSRDSEKFTITPAPFADNKITVIYDVMK